MSIECEVCKLPHRVGARRCDGCGHRIGTSIDRIAVERERSWLLRRMALAIVTIVAMLAINAWAFGGAGVILFVAPFSWFAWNIVHYFAVRRRLALIPRDP